MSDSPPAVEVRDLARSYASRRALQGVDLTVRPGEFVSIFGPNGAGKSTILKILARVVRPDRGSVRLLGSDVHGEAGDDVLARVGLMGHQPFVYEGLTGRENLLFFARMYGVADPGRRAAELLDELGLGDRADDPVRGYSRGMVQRLSAARALVQDPDVLLLDEPFTGLDPTASELLADMLGRIHGRGRTVLLTSHDLALGHRLCDRFLILARGRVVEESAAAAVGTAELAGLYRRRVAVAR